MFLKKYKNQILIGVAVLCLIYLVVRREDFIIERLTGNAPKELPLPSELKHSEMSAMSEQDKAKLDTREIPTGFTSESDYLLSPEMIKSLKKETTTPETKAPMTQEEKEEKIKNLEKELEELKKQLNK
jgi:hypothetical protein